MAITSTTYNDGFNEMPFAYLRTKRVAPFMKGQASQIPQREEPIDLCDCCDFDKRYVHPVVADVDDSDTYKNDYTSQLFEVPDTSSTLAYVLQKYTGTSFTNTVTLNSTYGTTYAPGIFPDYENFAGYRLNWRPVLTKYGEGIYRIKTTVVSFGVSEVFYSDAYCLKAYSEYSVDKTVRFEWNNNGIITYADDDFVRFDYGNINWLDMIRVVGSFGYPTDDQEVVDISFYSGNALEIQRIHDKTNYKYKFKSGYYPFNIHSILKNIAFKSNSLVVTTYGKLDKKSYTRKAIIKDSNGYSPKFDYVYKKWFNVEVDFKDKYEDLGARKNCDESGQNCEPVTIVDENGDTITEVPSGGLYVDSASSGASCSGDINVYIDGTLADTVTTTDYTTETLNIEWN